MAEEELHKTDADVSANDAADSNATVTDDVVVDAVLVGGSTPPPIPKAMPWPWNPRR